ncbi:MAG: 2-vinyl bacteriochlorophyllide hydratase [Kiloniellaceae bacterium]
MFASGVLDRWIGAVDCCPWSAHAGTHPLHRDRAAAPAQGLYTPEQRRRRNASPWTLVQGILAPLQFAVFLVSLYFVVHYLLTGEGYLLATASIIVKTLVLYTIMVTGSLWERDVFGRYLFAPAFFWEDVVSMLVLAVHSAYLIALFTGTLGAGQLMALALIAYATYVVNAAQFVLKLRAARREQEEAASDHGNPTGLLGAAE